MECHVNVVYSSEAALKKNRYLTMTNPGGSAGSFPLRPQYDLRPEIDEVTITDMQWCGLMNLTDYLCAEYTVVGANFFGGGVTSCALSKPGTKVYDTKYESDTVFHFGVEYSEPGLFREHKLTMINFGRISSFPWEVTAPVQF